MLSFPRILTIGESESVVRQKLKDYVLPASGAINFVWSKGTPPRYLGEVNFQNGKLSSATTPWLFPGHADLDFADALLKALASLEREGGTRCLIRTVTDQQQPAFDAKTMQISCPDIGRNLLIVMSRAHGQPPAVKTEARIEEWIVQPR